MDGEETLIKRPRLCRHHRTKYQRREHLPSHDRHNGGVRIRGRTAHPAGPPRRRHPQSKAARGELRRALPVGLVWGEADGEIGWHPDEAVTGVIAAVFERFAVCGSVRGVWLWLREQGLKFPLQRHGYVSGGERDHLGRADLPRGAHRAHPSRLRRRLHLRPHPRSTAASTPTGNCAPAAIGCRRTSGRCSSPTITAGSSTGTPTRPTRSASRPTSARGRTSPAPARCARAARCCRGWPPAGSAGANSPSTTTARPRPPPATTAPAPGTLVEGRGTRHLRVGGAGIDAAVTEAFLAALQPAALQACLAAAQQLEDGHDAALAQWRRQVEQARYEAGRAERRYRAVDPDNRLVARGLETEWNTALQALADAEAELARREAARPKTLTPQEKTTILALGDDLAAVWSAPTTTDKDRKQLLRSLLDEVNISVHRDHTDAHADLMLRWKGGAITDLTVPIKRKPPNRAAHRRGHRRPGAPPGRPLPRRRSIAHILNRQGRRTARGLSFTAGRVQSLRHHYEIACHTPTDDPQEGELLTVTDAAERTRPRPLHPAPLAGRRVHRRRATHPRRALAHPAHRRDPQPVRRRRPRRLARHAGGHPRLRRVPPNHHATCQARRTAKPSTCAPDAEKACVSSPHPPRKDCSNHDNQRKPQCDDASKHASMSASSTHR